MSVLYFGDPRGAIHLIEGGARVCGMVHGRGGGVGSRRLPALLDGVPRWRKPDLEDPQIIAALAATKPTLIVSCFYPRRIAEAVLALAPGINVHPSDLPRWRGPDPCYWAIREQDAHTAICVHQLETGLDEGAIIHREQVEIGARESGGHLATRMEARAAELVAEIALKMLDGEVFAAQTQTGETSWAPLIDPDAVEIDWTAEPAVVDAFIRAASPEPGAFTGIGDELLVVFSGTCVEAGKFAGLPPGTTYVRKGQAYVRCGKTGAYRLGWLRLGRRRITGKHLATLLV